MTTPPYNRRADDGLHQILGHQMEMVRADMSELKSAMKDVATAMTKLALVEERQAHAALAQDRTTKLLEKLETKVEAYQVMNVAASKDVERRIDTLEAEAPTNKQTSTWVFAGVTGFIAIVTPIIVNKFMGA